MLTEFSKQIIGLLIITGIVVVIGQSILKGLFSSDSLNPKACEMVKVSISEYRYRCQDE